jgi:hypothetical protein
VSIPLVTLTEVKTYLGLVGAADDVLIASIASNATAVAERHTGRVLAVTSNTTRTYSTNGNRALTIHDRPYSDPARVVTWNGADLTEGTDVWFLPDRRSEDVTTTIQLAPFDTTSHNWYLREPMWFDRNLDRSTIGAGGTPNDLVIRGVEGHPAITGDTRQALLELCAGLYYIAKSGASGTVSVNTDIDLSELSAPYQQWVKDWRRVTAVEVI